jgi:diaminopimelate epimerase
MGNPHIVFFVPDAEALPLEQLGPPLECHAFLPAKANIEIAQILDRAHIRMRVWERGAGITQACACATLVAAVRRGLTERKAELLLDGGSLSIEWRAADGHVLMTGPVAVSFTGRLRGY